MALANKAPRLQWDQQDEELLQSLVERKAAFKEKYEGELSMFVDRSVPFMTDATIKRELISWMAGNADAIRDLLEPFDSGVRPANVQPSA